MNNTLSWPFFVQFGVSGLVFCSTVYLAYVVTYTLDLVDELLSFSAEVLRG